MNFVQQTARNSLFASKPTGTRYLHKNGKDILWTDVVQLFKAQQSSMLAQQSRLSADSVFLNSYSKVSCFTTRNNENLLPSKPNERSTRVELFDFQKSFLLSRYEIT